MSKKQLLFDEDARQKILRGVEQLTDAVKATLGPRGRNVLIASSYGAPRVTHDGVTVAKEIDLADRFENIGAQMVREVASKTADNAGDGTTTATVLAHAIFREGLKAVASGASPISLKRGIDKAVEAVVKDLHRVSKPVSNNEEIRQVATVSANWDAAIGDIIAEAMEKVGKDGTITVEEAQSMDTKLEMVEGMQFDKGYLSPYFSTNPETMEAELENPLILLFDKKINSMSDILPLLQEVSSAGKSLLIVAEEVTGEALSTLVVNKLRGSLHVCAVRSPGFGDRRKAMMEDIAVITGGKFITQDLGIKLDKVMMEDLGMAKRIVIDKDRTTIIEGIGEKSAIQGRVAQIRRQIKDTTSDYDRENLRLRMAKLSSGIAIIKVGAPSEIEMKEKKDRVDDALCATNAAVEEGIVVGGGVALLRTIPALDKVIKKLTDLDEKSGANIVRKALEEPLRQLCFNAGAEGSAIVQNVMNSKEKHHGYNVSTAVYEDLYAAGVIDPTKVTREALQNAASISSLLLTTECIITEMD
jgi:chaperonin GroEL